MLNVFTVAAAVLLWAVVLARTKLARERGPQRALWFALVNLACAETLHIPALYDWGRANFGIAGISALRQVFTLGASAGVLMLLRGLTGRRGGLRLLTALTVVAVMAMAIPLIVVDPSTAFEEQAQDPAAAGAWALHWAVVLGYLGSTLVAVTWICAQYSRHAPPGRLRTGLGFVGLGTATGLVVVLEKTAVIITSALGGARTFTGFGAGADAGLLVICLVLIATGSGFEAIAVRREQLRRHLQSRRSLRHLQGLWQVMCIAVPYIALTPRGSLRGDRFSTQDRLYRRVMEIRDGLLALSGYAPVQVRTDAARLAGESGRSQSEAAAIAEATWLHVALAAKTGGHGSGSHLSSRQVVGGRTFTEEVLWLEQVATAYLHCPLVIDLAHRLTPLRTEAP